MKSVLISIQPKWCQKITHIIGRKGTKPIYEKSVEIRKTKPTIDVPFKCYIYCTQGKTPKDILTFAEYKNGEYMGDYYANGKVIGEFVCDRVQPFESEFVDDDCYESIASLDYDEDGDATGFIEWSNDSDFSYESTDFYKKCCVKYEELKKYMGQGINEFYSWHISDLVIYDEPKGLSKFSVLDDRAIKECEHRERIYVNPDSVNGAWLKGSYICTKGEEDWCSKCKTKPITRPPQSWCYVEGVAEKCE